MCSLFFSLDFYGTNIKNKKKMFQKGYYWISIVEEKKKLISQVVYFVTNWVYKKNEFET